MEEKELSLDITEIIFLLRRNIAIIFIIAIVFTIGGFIGTNLFITPKYSANSTMIVSNKMGEQQNSTTINTSDIQAAVGLVKTYGIIIKSDIVLNKVIENLGLTDTVESLSSQITVTALDDTQVMKIEILDKDPSKAQSVMEEITKVAPEIIVNSVGAGACNVLTQANVTNKPVSPNVTKNSVISFLLGGIIGIAIVLGKEFVNNTVKTEEDITEKLGIPVIGIVPKVEGK